MKNALVTYGTAPETLCAEAFENTCEPNARSAASDQNRPSPIVSAALTASAPAPTLIPSASASVA